VDPFYTATNRRSRAALWSIFAPALILSRTEWFNVPVVRFSGTAIDLFGQATTTQDLQDWAKKYYEHKVERALWVQVAPGNVENAERALLPLVRMFPDLQVRQVDFGFSCPKIHR